MQAQLTPALNLSQQKPSLSPGVEGQYTLYRSSTTEYRASDIISIQIPTGGARNAWLTGESFLQFKMTPTFTGATAGVVRLDNSAYSIFRSARLYHGSNELCSIQNCGRLWNNLLNYSGGTGTKNSASIVLGCDGENTGIKITSGHTYSFAMPLPMPIVGTLTDSAIPLGWMEAADLRLELEVSPMATVFTTSIGDVQATVGAATAEPVWGTMTLSDIYYNAKISKLEPALNSALIASFGDRPITIPSLDYRSESVHFPAGSNAINVKLNFQFRSLRAIMWQCCCQAITLGTSVSENVARAHAGYAGGRLASYYVDIDGMSIPSHRNQLVARAGANISNGPHLEQLFNSSVPFADLQRVLNQVGTGGLLTSVDIASYAVSVSSIASQHAAATNRFLTGIDLERASDTADSVFVGTNTKNSNVNLYVTYETASEAAQTMFVFGVHDVVFSLQQGSLIRSD